MLLSLPLFYIHTFTCNTFETFLATILYLYSFIADLLDGMAARKFNQCSTFGSLMDMVTDRCSTLGLLFILYGEYSHASGNQDGSLSPPYYQLTFLFLALLDISSHWCQMFSTASLQIHHKSFEGNANRFILVRWYYSYYPFFGYCCVSAELTYILLYVQRHMHIHTHTFTSFKDAIPVTWLPWLVPYLLRMVLPGCIMKQIVNVFQLTSACTAVASKDALERNHPRKVL